MLSSSCDFKSSLVGLAVGSGLFYAGYRLGLGTSSGRSTVVSKSYYSDFDSVKQYCNDHSTPLHQVQQLLFDETLKHKWSRMMGALEP